MAKHKRPQQSPRPSVKQTPAALPPPAEQSRGFGRFPLWVWIIVFIVPLVMSEFMFYAVGKTFSMIAFPILWILFWLALMWRSGWRPPQRRDK